MLKMPEIMPTMQMDNGSTVILYHSFNDLSDREHGIVLAAWNNQFVTWHAYAEELEGELLWHCDIGHYYDGSRLEAATADFWERVRLLV